MAPEHMFHRLSLLVCWFVISLKDIADSNFRHYGGVVNCSPIASSIQQLYMKKLCYKTILMDDAVAAYSLHPNERALEPLRPCMKCPVTIATQEHHFRMSVLVYSLETESSGNARCIKNRVDIFNGRRNEVENLLSGSGGLCGKALPGQTYVTSGNSVTVQLTTECSKKRPPKQTANFNIVVAKLNNNDTNACPGQFQCDDGKSCIDKHQVCNDVTDCLDHSDERKCPTMHAIFPSWMVALVVIATICILAFLVMFTVFAIQCCAKTLQKEDYSKM